MLGRGFASAVASVVLLAAPVGAQVYRWEADGTLYFSNAPDRMSGHQSSAEPEPSAAGKPAEPGTSPGPVTRIAFSPGTPIIVNARLSDSSGSVTLILDTGADRTVIAPHALSRLGISTLNAARAEIRGVTGGGQAEVVQVSSVQVGDARVGPLKVIAHDADLRQAEGLLGRDFLEHFTVTIDAREQVVTLAPK